MTRLNFQFYLFITFSFILFVNQAISQNKEVKYKFEVNGKITRQKFKVFFLIEGKEVLAKATNKKFRVPSKIIGRDMFSVRFSSKKYSLTFNPIYPKDLDSDWIIGVETKPFETNKFDSTLPSFDNVCLIHFLDFQGRGNILVIKIFNGDKACVKKKLQNPNKNNF